MADNYGGAIHSLDSHHISISKNTKVKNNQVDMLNEETQGGGIYIKGNINIPPITHNNIFNSIKYI